MLSTHDPDKLLTIVTDKELAKSVLIKFKDTSESDLVIVRDEADTSAWHILVASIEEPTSLAALEREYLTQRRISRRRPRLWEMSSLSKRALIALPAASAAA